MWVLTLQISSLSSGSHWGEPVSFADTCNQTSAVVRRTQAASREQRIPYIRRKEGQRMTGQDPEKKQNKIHV